MNYLLHAVQKCSHNYKKNWGGCLGPKEILALRDAGCKIDPRDLDIAIYWKRSGINNGRWIHFDANEKFEKLKGYRD